MSNIHYNMEKSLVNFRVPNELRKTFDTVCKYQSMTKTQILVSLMKRHIDEVYPKIEKEVSHHKNIMNIFHKTG
jgi:hypothetical protein